MYITVWDISTKKNCSGGLCPPVFPGINEIPAVIEDWHEPRLKVKDESNRRPDLKDLRRHFRYRCERIGRRDNSPPKLGGVAAPLRRMSRSHRRRRRRGGSQAKPCNERRWNHPACSAFF